jgi:hypothetical protein
VVLGLPRLRQSGFVWRVSLSAGDPTTLPFLMIVLIISKGVGDRFNYSVFHHQIMLKGFSYVGGIPEHLIKRAHLDVSCVFDRTFSDLPGISVGRLLGLSCCCSGCELLTRAADTPEVPAV